MSALSQLLELLGDLFGHFFLGNLDTDLLGGRAGILDTDLVRNFGDGGVGLVFLVFVLGHNVLDRQSVALKQSGDGGLSHHRELGYRSGPE